jgi:hypothetical protein
MRARAAELEGRLKTLRLEHEEVKRSVVDKFNSQDI